MIHRASHGERRRLLAIFAHPDDETFLAGGTLAKYAVRGWDVRVISATYGENGPRGDYESLSTNEFADLRRSELQAACKALGIHPPMFLECADRAVAAICWNSAAKEIARIFRRLQPDVVITFGPDGISGHPDHVALSQIVTSAFWATSIHTYPWEVGTRGRPRSPRATLYHVLRSASVPESCTQRQATSMPMLTTSIDIGDAGNRKLQAIRSYGSQKHLHPNGPAAIQSILRAPELFHRRFPRWQGGPIETELCHPQSNTGGLSKEDERATEVADCPDGDRQTDIIGQTTINVLAVVTEASDKTQVLRAAHDPKWNLRFAADVQAAESVLREMTVDVIISDSYFGAGHSWRDLLMTLRDMAEPGELIVADRHPDDALWLQVLNEGGFDLLAKPINWAELRHAVNVACSLRLKTREESQKDRDTTHAAVA